MALANFQHAPSAAPSADVSGVVGPGAPTPQLMTDSQAAEALLSLKTLSLLGLTLLAAYGAGRLMDAAVHVLWRFGFDPGRRLARAARLARLGVLAGAGILLLRQAWEVAPLFSSLILFVVVVGGLFASGYVSNVLVGIGLTLKQRVRVGDRIVIGGYDGVVRDVGFSRLHLRAADGSTVLIPNRLVNQSVLSIDRARNSAPVRVRLALSLPATPEQIERARQLAVLSPYRAPGSAVEVERQSEGSPALEIEIQAWGERARASAQTHLEESLSEIARSEAKSTAKSASRK